jgi:tetratricopeptide (TPR) repeat protein
MLCKYDSVAATYKTFLKKFPDDPARERALFSLAGVLDDDLNRIREAIGLYTKVMDEFPRGKYYKAALFARAECFDKLGRMMEAKIDYKKYRRLDPQGIWIAACVKRLKTIR